MKTKTHVKAGVGDKVQYKIRAEAKNPGIGDQTQLQVGC